MSSYVEGMTHDEIADFGAHYLRRNGYKFSCSNLTSAIHGEQPDVLGIAAFGKSIVLEAKVSRSDFKADLKKPWRKDPLMGMGDYRVYVTPKGLLRPEEVPYGWMLWEVHGKSKPVMKVIKGMKKRSVKDRSWSTTVREYVNCDRKEYIHFEEDCKEKNFRSELSWMVKVISRAIDDGFNPNDYANNYQKKRG